MNRKADLLFLKFYCTNLFLDMVPHINSTCLAGASPMQEWGTRKRMYGGEEVYRLDRHDSL